MPDGRVVVPLNRDIDWSSNAASVTCLYLLIEQVPFEGWVFPFWEFLGVKVEPAVMATRKTGNGVHPGSDQRFGEFLRVEIGSDAWNLFASVKVEMDLAER